MAKSKDTNSKVKTKSNIELKRNKKKHSTAKKPKIVQPKLPKCASDVSSNWKALSAVLSTTKKTKDNKRKVTESGFSNSKRRKTYLKEIHSKNQNVKSEIWFDNVDANVIEKVTGKKVINDAVENITYSSGETVLEKNDGCLNAVNEKPEPRSSKCVAMDCEFVGIGRDGVEHMLARVSVVNIDGDVLYDEFVAPQEKVIDYRTEVSGVRPSDLKNAPSFSDVQNDIATLIKNKTLIGHSLTTDLKVLFLDHPRKRIRDTAKYKPFQERMKTKRPSLKKLVMEVLSLSIQDGEHSSVEDARAAMQLYREHRKEWEKSIKEKFKTKKSGNKTS